MPISLAMVAMAVAQPEYTSTVASQSAAARLLWLASMDVGLLPALFPDLYLWEGENGLLATYGYVQSSEGVIIMPAPCGCVLAWQ